MSLCCGKEYGCALFPSTTLLLRKGYGHILQISPSHLSEQVASHTGLSAEAQPTHFTYTRHTHTPLHPICSIANSVQSVTPSPRPHHRTPLASATMIGASPSQAETCLTSHANLPIRFASFVLPRHFIPSTLYYYRRTVLHTFRLSCSGTDKCSIAFRISPCSFALMFSAVREYRRTDTLLRPWVGERTLRSIPFRSHSGSLLGSIELIRDPPFPLHYITLHAHSLLARLRLQEYCKAIAFIVYQCEKAV